MRIPFVAMPILIVGALTASPKAGHPEFPDRPLGIELGSTTGSVHIDEFTPSSCVSCEVCLLAWGSHWAQLNEIGDSKNPHSVCIENPAPALYCGGHPPCGGDANVVVELAIRALDGDLAALDEVLLNYPERLSLDTQNDLINILGCDAVGGVVASFDSADLPALTALLLTK